MANLTFPYSGNSLTVYNLSRALQIVMDSGSKSRVRVPFPGFGSGTKKVGFSSGFGRFWLPDCDIDGLGSGSGTISRVRVGFGYQKSRVFLGF